MIVDLRSDTVTRPTAEMRRAIAEAEVGDDVFGDDPTVIALENRVADLVAKEAAMFVPSGTMGNTICLTSITEPGDEVILERNCHIFNYEVAGVAAIGGVQLNAFDGVNGVITAEQIEPHIRPVGKLHEPLTRVIAIENTHNRASGCIFPINEMRRIRELADARNVLVHLDGARLANAVVASGVSFADYAACADTMSMCFSKGLGAPVGSIVAGSADMIARARRVRKRFGGGMRQVGVLAAAAMYALDHHIERMQDDHDRAKRIAATLAAVDGIELVCEPQTNIVIFDLDQQFASVDRFLRYLRDNEVLAAPFGANRVRFVTHLDIDDDAIAHACNAIESFASTVS